MEKDYYELINFPLAVEKTENYIRLEDGTIVYKSETQEEFEARIKDAKEKSELYHNSLTAEKRELFDSYFE